MATGVTTINFGSAPGDVNTSVVVTGQGSIGTGSQVEAYLMADDTPDHNADEHVLVPIRLRCGAIVAGTGFTIYAFSDWVLTGQFNVHWVWV